MFAGYAAIAIGFNARRGKVPSTWPLAWAAGLVTLLLFATMLYL
jgi:hypothetical protein